MRVRLGKVFAAEVGVAEQGCDNCGPRVETYLKASGNHRGEYWCGAFVCWCYKQVGLQCPAGAGAARNWFPAPKIIYTRGSLPKQVPKMGDCVGYYYANLGRIGHVGFVEKWGDDYVITVEGNTGRFSSDVSRNGGGVHRMRRLHTQISYVSNWIDR